MSFILAKEIQGNKQQLWSSQFQSKKFDVCECKRVVFRHLTDLTEFPFCTIPIKKTFGTNRTHNSSPVDLITILKSGIN